MSLFDSEHCNKYIEEEKDKRCFDCKQKLKFANLSQSLESAILLGAFEWAD